MGPPSERQRCDDDAARRRGEERNKTRRAMAGLVNERPYVSVNVDHEGFTESENPLFKHVAIRDREQDSTYDPKATNIAPRPKTWQKTDSNTQKSHTKVEAIEAPKE